MDATIEHLLILSNVDSVVVGISNGNIEVVVIHVGHNR